MALCRLRNGGRGWWRKARKLLPCELYAYEETGLIVTQENRRLIPDVELLEFDAKVREYQELIADDKPNTG